MNTDWLNEKTVTRIDGLLIGGLLLALLVGRLHGSLPYWASVSVATGVVLVSGWRLLRLLRGRQVTHEDWLPPMLLHAPGIVDFARVLGDDLVDQDKDIGATARPIFQRRMPLKIAEHAENGVRLLVGGLVHLHCVTVPPS